MTRKNVLTIFVCLLFAVILITGFLCVFFKTEIVHLIVLAGQSNCEGVSSSEKLKNYVSEEEYLKFQKGFENVKIKSSSNRVDANAFVKCRLGQGTNEDCFGLEVGMGDYLSKNFPNEKFYFVKRAHGGTPIFPYWNAPEENVEMGVNLRLLIEDVKLAIDNLKSKRKKVVIDAFCWMQGESDADEMSKVNSYQKYLSGMVKLFRETFKEYNANEIRFVDCEITNYEPAENYYHHQLNKEKKSFSEKSENNFCIDIDSLNLTKNLEPDPQLPDYWHFDSESMLKLGRIFGSFCLKNLNS